MRQTQTAPASATQPGPRETPMMPSAKPESASRNAAVAAQASRLSIHAAASVHRQSNVLGCSSCGTVRLTSWAPVTAVGFGSVGNEPGPLQETAPNGSRNATSVRPNNAGETTRHGPRRELGDG